MNNFRFELRKLLILIPIHPIPTMEPQKELSRYYSLKLKNYSNDGVGVKRVIVFFFVETQTIKGGCVLVNDNLILGKFVDLR